MKNYGFILLGIVILIAAFLLYGSARYHEGVSDTDKRWTEASVKLEAQAKEAGTKADEASDLRLQDYSNRLIDQKEKLDEANAQGNSPFDVLFKPTQPVSVR